MNLLFEDMICAKGGGLICRIWREHGPDISTSNEDIKSEAMGMLYAKLDLRRIAEILIAHDRVNSVEVINRETRDGICVHKDWP